MANEYNFFIAGNPNCGKTCLFNAITGMRQHTGNYPGVTVEKKVGHKKFNGKTLTFTDLPGAYNLTTFSIEEKVARKALLEESPSAVINVVDSTNLERNLYLSVSIMEMGLPVLLALNMCDIAKQHGIKIDTDVLSRNLGIPIVSTVANRGKGIDELLQKAIAVAERQIPDKPFSVKYGATIEEQISRSFEYLVKNLDAGISPPLRWLAVKLIEGDEEISEYVYEHLKNRDELKKIVAMGREEIESHYGDPVEVVMAEKRYGLISGVSHPAISHTVEAKHHLSDHIDLLMTNRFIGIPIFLLMMYAVFYATFRFGDIPMGWLDSLFGWLQSTIAEAWSPDSAGMLRSLLIDGIIGGVGGVLVFLPNIIILFFAIAILEETGYMSRAAFLMDRVMRAMGLHGKSFIPFMVGFGCTVPAVMATRTLETPRDRLITILVLPLVSCGARLPIYALLIPAFFPVVWRGPVLWGIYILGILLAILLAKLLSRTMLKGDDTPLVMELPPYRVPTFRALTIHSWQRSKEYLKKAGTVILAISIIIWLLGYFPKPPEAHLQGLSSEQRASYELEYSALGRIGKTLEPVTEPMGFDWKVNTALLGAVAAKEVFVAQIGVVMALGDVDETTESLRKKISNDYSPLMGLALLVFLLIATPCMATFAIVKKETQSWKWAAFQWLSLTGLGYILAFAVYQIGNILVKL